MRRLELTRDKVSIGTFVKTDSAHVVEVLGTTAMNFGVLDAEHAPYDRSGLDRMVLAGHAADLPLLVRIPDFSATWIQTVLDIDAAGILVPHVDTEEDARTVVQRARFRGGSRGFSISARFGAYGTRERGEAIARGDASVVMCQIESAQAVDNALRIAQTDGVHALFVGRADLGMSMGIENPRDARVLDAARHAIDAALAAGKVASMNAATLEEAAGYAAWGVSCFVMGTDQALLRSAAHAIADPDGKRLRQALVPADSNNTERRQP